MDVVEDGCYVVVQRYQYMRTLLVKSSKPMVQLGKDSIDFSNVIGCKYGSTFKMTPHPTKSKGWLLEMTSQDQVVDFEQQFEEKLEESGSDNRDLLDANCSQTLKR